MNPPGEAELVAIAIALYARAARETRDAAPSARQRSRWLETARRANVRVDLPASWRG